MDGSNTVATVTFDAWGRVVSVTYAGGVADNGGSPVTLTQNFYYDALNRQIATNTVNSNGVYVVGGSITYYDIGNNPIEEKPTDAAANAPSVEYAWSEAGPSHLVEKNYLYGMFFPITDAAGSVTAVVNTSGAVAERYIYNCDGEVQAYSATWNSFAASNSSGVTTSQIGWNILWHGMRYDSLFFGGERVPYTVSNPGVPPSTYNETEATGGGFYFGTSGGGWYDPQHGRALVPNPNAPATNPYDPHAGTLFESTWLANHAAGVAAGATIVAALGVTIATAGLLAPEAATLSAEAIAAGEVATVDVGALAFAGAVGGAAGGAVGGGLNSYAAGNHAKQITIDATVGAVAGAAGGAAGVYGGSAVSACPAAIEAWVAGGIVGGTVGGAIQGGYSGYQQNGLGGIADGALNGAMTGAVEGAIGGLVGYGAFRGLGLLSGYACFLAGTEVATGTVDDDDQTDVRSAVLLSAVATLHFLSRPIETLNEGDEVLGRDENDPFAPLRFFVVDKVFRVVAYHLRIVTLRMSDGREQTIFTTDEHRAHSPETNWTPVRGLEVGDQISEGAGGSATVIATRVEQHPEGIEVFNLQVAEAHTYLVRAAGFAAEPIWVHNACEWVPEAQQWRDAETGQFRGGSVWKLGSGDRGLAVEDVRIAELGEEGRLPEGFETFDHYDDATGEATSIKSYDTRNGYANANSLYNKIVGHINEIADFEYAERETTDGMVELDGADIQSRVLDATLATGASPEQLSALGRATAYANSRGVILNVGFAQ